MIRVVSYGLEKGLLMNNTAVLLLSFGTPRTPEDLVSYMTSIRGGRIPTERDVAVLRQRYDAIHQWDSLTLQTMVDHQRFVLQDLLNIPVYAAYLHISNSMETALKIISEQGYTHIIGIVTSPFYSTAGTGAYERKLDSLLANYPKITVEYIKEWWEQASFLSYWCDAVTPYIGEGDGLFVYSAHSVPKYRMGNYKNSIIEAAHRISGKAGIGNWKLAFQSAPPRDGWLGPSVESMINESLREGTKRIIFVPFGFVNDHVEVLYDNDVECRKLVEAGGAVYNRAPMPNGNLIFMQAMASAITERLEM